MIGFINGCWLMALQLMFDVCNPRTGSLNNEHLLC